MSLMMCAKLGFLPPVAVLPQQRRRSTAGLLKTTKPRPLQLASRPRPAAISLCTKRAQEADESAKAVQEADESAKAVQEADESAKAVQEADESANANQADESTKASQAGGQAEEKRSVGEYDLAEGEIAVRFINSPLGHDVVAAAEPGEPLLRVGDSVGVCIPRACQSGLCGTCTTDVLDETAESGRQTIRACQAGVAIPDGNAELVVDVERMKKTRAGKDPMARFENLDTGYVAGAAPKGSRTRLVTCGDCDGSGRIVCYECEGTGFEAVDEGNRTDEVSVGETYVCLLCAGMKTVRCATCQGATEIRR